MAIQGFETSGSAQSASVAVKGAMGLPGFVMSFSRNEEIFGEKEEADFAYQVLSGAVRTMRFLNDGRRQIDAFHLPGDVFGLEMGPVHGFSAEAVSDSQIALVRRAHIERAAARECSVARALWALTASDLTHARDHMLTLARKSATERVGAFLLEMIERIGSPAFELPMSRLDIADYLGLTIETVSRTLTQMERDGMIELPTCRGVVLRNRAALAA